MAYDEALADRIRKAFASDPTFSEKKMFGGIAFLHRGLMVVGVNGDTLMARVGKQNYQDSLEREHVREMDFTGRPMQGYVYVDAPGIRTEAQLNFWLQRCRQFVATLPDSGTIGLVRRAIDEDGARRIIYMGGDGTFADVAKGILASVNAHDVAMGMLPTGTANDQGKSFGLRAGPAGFADNVRVIAAGITTVIDVGRIALLDAGDQVARSDLFFDSASIGWGAAVLRTRNVVLATGLLVSTVARTQQQAMMASMFFIMTPMIYLSGFLFPIENMPPAIQAATWFLPLRYFAEVVRGMFLKGATWTTLWPQTLALVGFAIVLTAVAARRFRKTLD